MTTFFEPINVSAPHVYHSALELSPLSSIVRRLYHHQRIPFPRVATGIPDSWAPSTAISSMDYSHKSSITWSPCGQFVATRTEGAVEVRDAPTLELTSTLQPTEPTSQLTGSLAYSPDGRSLACASHTAIVIWDSQTGGVVREIQHNTAVVASLVWSLDGGLISAMGWSWKGFYALTVHTYDIASGTTFPPIALQSHGKPYLWAHDESFRVMTTARDGNVHTVDIFEVRSAPTKIESFPARLGTYSHIRSFSPTMYLVSAGKSWHDIIRILDLRTSKYLLDGGRGVDDHCFSSDGSLFAASHGGSLRIWKADTGTGTYILWGEFPCLAGSGFLFLFSPTLQSILGHSHNTLRLWRLNGLSVAPVTHNQQLGVFSRSGTYMATSRRGGDTVTITNLLSQTPSQLINTGIKVFELGLTDSVLLVVGSEVVVAWLLTGEGLVNGVFGNGKAGRGDSIWTVSTSRFRPWDPIFSVEGEYTVIKTDGDTPHVYNTRTGEVLESARAPLHPSGSWYSLVDITLARHHTYNNSAQNPPPEDDWRPSRIALEKGWVKDREGKRLLWLPIEWRVGEWHEVQWFSDIATMRYSSQGEPITIKLYQVESPPPDPGVGLDP